VIVSKPNRTGNLARFILFGQDVGGPHTGTLYLVNNTLVANSSWIEFVEATSAGSRIEASNNVFAGSSRLVRSSGASLAGAHNWVRSGAAIPAEFLGTIIGSDPGFVDGTARDFRLSSGSSARNIGASTVFYRDGSGITLFAAPEFEYVNHFSSALRSSDGAVDAGAYELGGSSNRPPHAVIAVTATSGPAPLTVTVDGRGSSDPDGVVAAYAWDFGDSAVATGATATHTYVAQGAFVVRLTVTDSAGATHSVSQVISVTAPPVTGGAHQRCSSE
jgi:hypothetical protein